MKTILKSVLVFNLVIGLSSGMNSFGQLSEVGNMLGGGAEDAQKLLQPYITPAVNAFGAALSGGWYNTAEPHKLGGFDITFSAISAIVPSKYQTFIIDDSDFNVLKLASPQENVSQTISGEGISGPQIQYDINGTRYDAFRMPEGINTKWMPAAAVQAGIGLIKGTDVMFRYLPNIRYEGNEIGLWGIAGRHDLKQWLPGVKKLPVFKMSLMYGFTKLHTFVEMNIDKDAIGASGFAGPETWENQHLKMWVKSHTANLLVAADLKIVTFYGGLGFVSTKTNLKMEGVFPIVQVDGTDPVVVESDLNPIDMEIKNQDGSITKPRFNAGVRFKFAIVTLHFDYSWANYSVLSAGLGFSYR